MLNQNFQDPFVAIVIDPVRTISAGKVNLGAFRTYPKGNSTVISGSTSRKINFGTVYLDSKAMILHYFEL